MSLSTLVGTTWLIKENPDVFTSYFINSINFSYGEEFENQRTALEVGYDDTSIYYGTADWEIEERVYCNGWSSMYTGSRYVYFDSEVSGEDYTALIAWLEDNAVQIPTDLTGTSWLIKDSPDLSTDTTWSVLNFTSDGNSSRSYKGIKITSSALRYYYSSTGYSTAKSSTAWTSEGYKTIHITGGSLVEDENLIFWLVNNATQIIDDAKLYVGVNNLSSKLGNKYIGVNNQSRKLVKGYIGVNNLSQKIF